MKFYIRFRHYIGISKELLQIINSMVVYLFYFYDLRTIRYRNIVAFQDLKKSNSHFIGVAAIPEVCELHHTCIYIIGKNIND